MPHTVPLRAFGLAVMILGATVCARGQEKDNASPEDRKLVGEILRDALAGELAKAKPGGAFEDRHREEGKIKIGPIEKTVVTWWRSKVELHASFPDPGKQLKADVPVMKRGEEKSALSCALSAPVKGTVAAEAKSDDGGTTLLTIPTTGFRCVLDVKGDCVLTRKKVGDKVVYGLQVTR